MQYEWDTIESGYLAHAPDESTTATCALDNGTHSLALSTILTRPHLSYCLTLTSNRQLVRRHAIVATYVPVPGI